MNRQEQSTSVRQGRDLVEIDLVVLVEWQNLARPAAIGTNRVQTHRVAAAHHQITRVGPDAGAPSL